MKVKDLIAKLSKFPGDLDVNAQVNKHICTTIIGVDVCESKEEKSSSKKKPDDKFVLIKTLDFYTS